MSVSGTTYALRYTKLPMVYQSGKSRLLYVTGVMMTPVTSGVTSYMGLFNVDTATPPTITAGMYFKGTSSGLSWGEVTQTGTTEVAQASWNIDTFSSSAPNPSGITLTTADLANCILLVFDQEWLGVGRIRLGFIINGITYYAHQFTHSSYQIQYTSTPRLNICYYISATEASSTMRQMCCTSMSEGGYYSLGRHNSVGNGSTLVQTNSSSPKTCVLFIKTNSTTYPYSTFSPRNLSIYNTGGSGSYVYYEVQMHSTNGTIGVLSGTPNYSSLTNSCVQYATKTILNALITVTTDGYVLTSGYAESRANISFNISAEEAQSTRLIFSQYDTLVVVISASSNGSTGATIDFVEDS
jgi:hypothetical protein